MSTRKLWIASLEPLDHELTTKRIREVWPGEAEEMRLEIHLLRRFKISNFHIEKENSIILLLHCFSGRTLLTDEDGLYNSFLVEATAATGGQVFLALTGVPADDGLAREDLIRQLVHEGQTSILDLHRQSRFFTWDELPNHKQLARIVDLKPSTVLQLPTSIRQHAASSNLAKKRVLNMNKNNLPHNHANAPWRCTLL